MLPMMETGLRLLLSPGPSERLSCEHRDASCSSAPVVSSVVGRALARPSKAQARDGTVVRAARPQRVGRRWIRGMRARVVPVPTRDRCSREIAGVLARRRLAGGRAYVRRVNDDHGRPQVRSSRPPFG